MPLDFEKAMKTDPEVVDPGQPEDFVPKCDLHELYKMKNGLWACRKCEWKQTEKDSGLDNLETLAPPAKIDPMDPQPLLALFDKYVAQIDSMIGRAREHIVRDDKSNARAVEMTTQAKKVAQTIAKQHKELKAPYLTVIQPLDSFKKGLADKLAGIQSILNAKITPYLRKKEVERREKQRLADEEARKIQAKLDAEAKEKADALRKKLEAENKPEEAAAVQIEVPPLVVAQIESELKISTPSGSAKLAKKWVWEIEDFKKIPDEIFEQRKDKIKEAMAPAINPRIAAGIRSIPGIKIFEVTTSETRTKR